MIPHFTKPSSRLLLQSPVNVPDKLFPVAFSTNNTHFSLLYRMTWPVNILVLCWDAWLIPKKTLMTTGCKPTWLVSILTPCWGVHFCWQLEEFFSIPGVLRRRLSMLTTLGIMFVMFLSRNFHLPFFVLRLDRAVFQTFPVYNRVGILKKCSLRCRGRRHLRFPYPSPLPFYACCAVIIRSGTVSQYVKFTDQRL